MIRHIRVKVRGESRPLFKHGERFFIKYHQQRYPNGAFPHWRLLQQGAERRFLWVKRWVTVAEPFWLEDDDFDPVVEFTA